MTLNLFRALTLSAFAFFATVALAQNSSWHDVRDYGAAGDGVIKDTDAINAAIAACTEQGGGTVYFPAGTYLTGSIHMESNLTLHVDNGAELLYSGDPEDSPVVKTRWEGTEVYTYSPLIYAYQKENIAVVGGGLLNGAGVNWWWRTTEDPAREHIAMPGKLAWKALLKRIQEEGYEPVEEDFEVAMHYLRPSLIQSIECKKVLFEGISLLDSPMWMLHPIYCEDLQIRGVKFSSHGPNGDGIDLDSCRNVRISDCFFDTYDDCIVIKSGRDAQGRAIGRPTEFVTITNCVMYQGNGGVVIGSEMSGGIRNITASNIVCYGTDRGIRLKTARGRGAVVENLRFDNWVIENSALESIQISSNYVDLPEEDFSERTPTMRNVAISNVTIVNAAKAINIAGLPEQKVEGLRFSDIVASGEIGLNCDLAEDVEFNNVRINARTGAQFSITNSKGVVLNNVGSRQESQEPVVSVRDVEDLWLTNSHAVAANETFLEVNGAETSNIAVTGSEISNAATPLSVGEEVSEGEVLFK
ncbi:glycoside hydrolase family 28 protein [Pelagicoccus albus]|uniref:Glycoside hydrolase family 28 protein n=1 Tax=Pelagicoccus albus TaxID=415222 RepID=A0A7X1B982_9BACT|nr:glycoside hydrolase family 28 protein [Pelagicoccus albus]MBC2608035.1 glycoside hydrolase family 28 protein [Pelagicoccus albus]